MEEVVYKPYRNRVAFRLGIIYAIIWALILVFCEKIQYFPVVLLTAGLICCNALTYRGQIRINSKGIFADTTKPKQSTFISWSQIKGCKYYEGGVDSLSVCVLFQKLDFPFGGQQLYFREDAIQLNRAGRVLCDVDLRKLSFGHISPEQFTERDVFGIITTKNEYDTIKNWWEGCNNAKQQNIN